MSKYKLVPIEPTREMLAAAGDAVVTLNSQHHDAISEAVYKAMLAAAPYVEQAPANPMPVLQVDAKVYVWDVPEVKHKRHFSHFDEYGYVYTFTDGKTSFTSRGTEVSRWLDWDFAE